MKRSFRLDVGLVLLIFASPFLQCQQLTVETAQKCLQSRGFAASLVVDVTVILIVAGMSRRSGWAGSHRLALAAGAALAYGWHAFLQMPVDGTTGIAIRASNAVCLLVVLALIAYAARRQVRYAI